MFLLLGLSPLIGHSLLLARRSRFVRHLLEGDPLAWSLLGGVVVIGLAVTIVKAQRNRPKD